MTGFLEVEASSARRKLQAKWDREQDKKNKALPMSATKATNRIKPIQEHHKLTSYATIRANQTLDKWSEKQ